MRNPHGHVYLFVPAVADPERKSHAGDLPVRRGHHRGGLRVLRGCPGLPASDGAAFSEAPGKLDGVILFSRLLEGDFLDYERAIPKENRVFVRLKTREFIDCVERASLLVDEKLKTPLRCRFTDGNLNISCSTQYGRVNDNIHADKQGDDIEIGFNHRYLLDALRAVRAEEIIASLSTPLFSMILSPADEEEDSKTLYLVVPVRLKD